MRSGLVAISIITLLGLITGLYGIMTNHCWIVYTSVNFLSLQAAFTLAYAVNGVLILWVSMVFDYVGLCMVFCYWYIELGRPRIQKIRERQLQQRLENADNSYVA